MGQSAQPVTETVERLVLARVPKPPMEGLVPAQAEAQARVLGLGQIWTPNTGVGDFLGVPMPHSRSRSPF